MGEQPKSQDGEGLTCEGILERLDGLDGKELDDAITEMGLPLITDEQAEELIKRSYG